jgi:hypothetical protein
MGQIWSAPLWALALLVASIAFETTAAGSPVAVIALIFAWGLYMLRWPPPGERTVSSGSRRRSRWPCFSASVLRACAAAPRYSR